MMKLKLVITTLSLLFIYNCHAENIDKSIVKVTGTYQKINDIDNLPSVITDFFTKREVCPGIANPQSEFNSSCNMEGTAPCNRLISAGHYDDVWWLNYESGGGAHTYNFLAFRLNGNSIYSLLFQNWKEQIRIDELSNKLSKKAQCNPKDGSGLYIYEKLYGLCSS